MENEDKNKEPVQEEKKDKKAKKEKKPKEPKKKWPKFTEIDITKATEDDIIQSGIRYNTKSDIICYCLMALVVVMMFVPPALRITIPKPITEELREITYTELTCYRTVARDGYELSSEVHGSYRQGEVTKVEVKHSYKKIRDDAPEEYSFAEINEFLGVEEIKGFKASRNQNTYNFEINYKSNSALSDHDILKDYAYMQPQELSFLSGQNYYCGSEVETVEEWVDVETGEKIRDK